MCVGSCIVGPSHCFILLTDLNALAVQQYKNTANKKMCKIHTGQTVNYSQSRIHNQFAAESSFLNPVSATLNRANSITYPNTELMSKYLYKEL